MQSDASGLTSVTLDIIYPDWPGIRLTLFPKTILISWRLPYSREISLLKSYPMGIGFRLPKDEKFRYMMIYTLARLPVSLIARKHRGQYHAPYYLRATLEFTGRTS